MKTDLEIKPFALFDKEWALLTAGDINNHNSMTISWGGMGTLWSKPVVTVYVKPIRYTHDFMENNDYFVISFFEEQYRKALVVMGSKSGRNINKDKEAKLTPIEHNKAIIYKEAKVTIICKKIYQNDLNINNIPDAAISTYYKAEKPHTMYIGEVVEILK